MFDDPKLSLREARRAWPRSVTFGKASCVIAIAEARFFGPTGTDYPIGQLRCRINPREATMPDFSAAAVAAA